MKEYKYRCFGLVWSIPFECPELTPLSDEVDSSNSSSVDVTVSIKDIASTWNQTTNAGPTIRVEQNRAFFDFVGIGKYIAEHGDTIYLDTNVKITNSARLFLFGTVSSLLLLQRGLIPLHGSGFLFKGQAVLFIGHSGYGKSTTLAGFIQKGYTMLTDDIAAIDTTTSSPVVLPSFPSMKLWEDSLTMLDKSTQHLEYVRENRELQKFRLPVDTIASKAFPIHTIYILKPSDNPSAIVTDLPNKKKVNGLIDHTFQKMALKRQNLHQEHFFKVMKIANTTRIMQLNRPKDGKLSLEAFISSIEKDLISYGKG